VASLSLQDGFTRTSAPYVSAPSRRADTTPAA
jgi:hypothetical protein